MKKIGKSTLSLVLRIELMLILLIAASVTGFFFHFQQVSLPVPTVEAATAFTALTQPEITPNMFEKILTETPAPKTTQIPIVDFSLSIANKNIPEDILEEAEFYGGGGGYEYNPPCETDKNKSGILYLDEVSVYFAGYPFYIRSCGWENEEKVTITWVQPDGTTRKKTVKAQYLEDTDESNAIAFAYLKEYAPVNVPGEYTFRFSGKSGILDGSFFIPASDEARFIQITPQDGIEFILYNFQPYEKIRLFLYQPTKQAWLARLVGWQAYQLDESGQMALQISDFYDVGGYYVVVGEQSGEVRMNEARLEDGTLGFLVSRIRMLDIP